ncbi:putative bifunctional diguanylate cyclase/phosphodiesterase [Chitinilyticum piscinae]|uniref:EAL domain-containing protein n=1 Tax=Chitinilyticum piscinae TaxID=2866724 RepID=A0A8J7FZ91_9NEIS|nr:bifunctional diguanylate cyclase/phosphodiesterase [Chitinilyticum piscinae]MBE9609065.1 EAL domain-containing protein [Chitinilyticum piscinae]
MAKPKTGSSTLPLGQLSDFLQRQPFDDRELAEAIARILEDGGVFDSHDHAIYLDFFRRLHAGNHDPELWPRLSTGSLLLGAPIFVAWHDLLSGHCGSNWQQQIDHLAWQALAVQLGYATPRQKAVRQSHTLDPGTGLPNTNALGQLLTQARERTEPGKLTALLHIDFGSAMRSCSNHTLLVAAERLRAMQRHYDSLLLIDRHTLGLLLPNLSGSGHAMLAAHRAMALLAEGLELGGLTVRLHPQIGIALSPEHGSEPSTLLSAAAQAAHEFTQNGIGLYDPGRDWLGLLIRDLEHPLREALLNNRFQIVFQPQLTADGRQLHGMEALLRWHDETLGQVAPNQLLRVAEHLGLMSSVTQWIINAAMRRYRELLDQDLPGTLSINLTPSNLRDPELPAFISNACAIWRIPGDRLVFEITESAVIDDLDSALRVLEQIKSLGCRLAMDDFGTGFSSLTYLKRLPIDEVKIDMSFIQEMRHSRRDADIVQSVIELAQRLGLLVIAEGVEDEATCQLLQGMHCNVIQGYIYSRPLAPEQLPGFWQTLAAGDVSA